MEVWSVEREICAVAQSPDLTQALISMGLMRLCPVSSIDIVRDWWQAGAESFCYVFTITGPVSTEMFILKSFVPFPGTRSVTEALELSQRRAADLALVGVKSPPCYGAFSGTAMYSYIPHSLTEMLTSPLSSARQRLVLGEHAKLLIRSVFDAGYQPRDLVRDLRSDGRTVYMVDFGWDLGDAHTGNSESNGRDSALATVDQLMQRANVEQAPR